ncbi:hypothetical protein LL279_02035 [Zunongwangia profunda]|nr:hypothetical protein [Zunongwangia profunda]
MNLNRLHKPLRCASLFISPYQFKILKLYQQQKKGNSEGAMGSKSKIKLMKSYKNIQKEAAPKKTKKENAQDIISKSLQKI